MADTHVNKSEARGSHMVTDQGKCGVWAENAEQRYNGAFGEKKLSLSGLVVENG